VFPGFEFIGGLVFVYTLILAASSLISLAIPYIVLRMRDSRSGTPDPQIGIKAALYYFFSVGIILFLTGLTTLIMDILVDKKAAPGQGMNAVQRTSLGVMTSGAFFALLHLALIKGATNDRNPAARRIFAGWRLAIHGMVVVLTSTIFLGILFQKDFGGDSLKDVRRQLLGVLLVWVPSWVLHFVLVRVYSQPLYEPSRQIGGD
jgi:hypothetical protein